MPKSATSPRATFADRLAYARAVWELLHGSPNESDEALAERMGVSWAWLRKWKLAPEYGGHGQELGRLADALGCSMDWLLAKAGAEPPLPERWGSWINERTANGRVVPDPETGARTQLAADKKAARAKAANKKNGGKRSA